MSDDLVDLVEKMSSGEIRVLCKMSHGAGHRLRGPDEALYKKLERKGLVEWMRGVPVTITDKGIRAQAIIEEGENAT